MADITQITNYAEEVIPYLLQQYQDSPKLKSIIKSLCFQADDLETALFEIRDMMWLDTALGIQLDFLGLIFGEERKVRSDSDYRQAIIEKASKLLSGTPEDIIGALLSFYGGTYAKYERGGLADFTVTTDAVITDTQLEALSPAGVGSHAITPDRDFLLYIDTAEPIPFIGSGYLYLIGD
jgi:hypothetical protein